MTEETIVMQSDSVFRWDGRKRKQTILKAKLGRLVLTTERLLFMSTGKSDLSVGKVALSAMSPIAGLMTSSTSKVDLSGIVADGGLEVPLSRLRTAELKGMFKCLTVTWADERGAEVAATFAPKTGGMPDGKAWVAELDRARQGGAAGPASAG